MLSKLGDPPKMDHNEGCIFKLTLSAPYCTTQKDRRSHGNSDDDCSSYPSVKRFHSKTEVQL
jgi:hypothetical protein